MLSDKRLKKGLWWEKAWYLVDGCTEVDSSCLNCWARSYTERFNKHKKLFLMPGRWTRRTYFKIERLNIVENPKPTVYSVWNDLLHEKISLFLAASAFNAAIQNPQHTFLFLTKRPHRLPDLFMMYNYIHHDGDLSDSDWFAMTSHIWVGTSIFDNSDICKNRLDALSSCSFLKNKFLSMEPMLGFPPEIHSGISLVIAGCESGPGRRHVPVKVLDNIIYQCNFNKIKLFVKQWEMAGRFKKLPIEKYSSLPF